MIGLIHKYVVCGIGVSLKMSEFNSIVPPIPRVGSPYVFCMWGCMAGVANWVSETGYEGDIAYFFESGHRHQSGANRIMDEIFAKESERREYRYVSHGFIDKKKSAAVQAADLFAWQFFKERKRIMEKKRRPREDFRSLSGIAVTQ